MKAIEIPSHSKFSLLFDSVLFHSFVFFKYVRFVCRFRATKCFPQILESSSKHVSSILVHFQLILACVWRILVIKFKKEIILHLHPIHFYVSIYVHISILRQYKSFKIIKRIDFRIFPANSLKLILFLEWKMPAVIQIQDAFNLIDILPHI